MKKAFSAVVATALVLLMIAAGVVSLTLGRIVKAAVETAGPRALGVPVRLGLVTISPWSGRGVLRDVVVDNPPGFKSAHAASVSSIEIEVKLSSLLSDTIVVERVAVREPELIWELGPEGSNLTALQRAAEASASGPGGDEAGAPSAAAGAKKKGKSLLIREFSVTGGKVGVSATALGGPGLSARLPDVRLTNLGGPGRSPSEAAAQALTAIAGSAQGAVSNAGGSAIDAARSLLDGFLKRNRK